ncbi:hypothetical protein GB928_028905 [Shinella curvata]|uniref:Peptidase M10 serralysin C-terminal domain-containing protein n=1 Tax=Shinella curvata TaxID=1817964 RepID=A0ABT8XN91_9HYPH|nr:calcium-binding protein [Shinella curvata]MCJ8057308.1 hypothetical protein [Shinella curvata]MDO6125205.1 hypothetical protein [Shinella curvata]
MKNGDTSPIDCTRFDRVRGAKMGIIKGNSKDNRLVGDSDVFGMTNEIYGYGGNDTLKGGFFADNYVWGGIGDDEISGGTRINRLYGEDGNDTLRGSGSDDQLYGGAGNDTLFASDNGAYLDGGAGSDWMVGGAGADTFIVGSSKDQVEDTWVRQFDNEDNPIDTVRAGVSFTLANSALIEVLETTKLTGTKAINLTGNNVAQTIRGNAGANTLDGKSGNDTLRGEAGNDRLVGGSGADKLYGGAGKDVFVFTSPKDSTASRMDMVYDFSHKERDRIDVSTIDARDATSKNDAFTFIGEKAFSEKAGELRYFHKSGDTFVYGDMDGDGKADFALRLDKTIDLVKGDFIL